MQKSLDKSPDLEAVKRARRWLRGAAMILADASNGDPLINRIALDAANYAVAVEIVIATLESQDVSPVKYMEFP